jgi:acyl-CoA thioesterase FadM
MYEKLFDKAARYMSKNKDIESVTLKSSGKKFDFEVQLVCGDGGKRSCSVHAIGFAVDISGNDSDADEDE